MLPNPLKMLELKERAVRGLEEVLGRGGVRRALRDPHSRRVPRACGITVHPGWGCSLGCLYCYVPDMGFPPGVREYPLSGEELAYALAANPHVIPCRTLAAVGSVTEPFLPELVGRTLEYVKALREWLGLPTQVSTKLIPPERVVREAVAADPNLSVLVSASTLGMAGVLEPRAPNPLRRIGGWGEILKAVGGFRADLFLRPLIPGAVGLKDIRELLRACVKAGFGGVVAGSLRVTAGNLRRLAAAGIDVSELLRRAGLREPPRGRAQVPVDVRDLKEAVAREARALGLQNLPSACAANVVSHGMACWLCGWGPCGRRGEVGRLKEVLMEGLEEYVEPAVKAFGGELLGSRTAFRGGAPEAVLRVRWGGRPAVKTLSTLLSECLKVRVRVA